MTINTNILEPALHLLHIEEVPQEGLAEGRMIRITGSHGLSCHEAIYTGQGSSLHVLYVYDSRQNYKVVYVEVDEEGKVRQALLESAGVLPHLFLSPGGLPYASIQDPMKNNTDVVLPILNRKGEEKPKTIRSLTGDYVGNIGDGSLFHQRDLFNSRKEDRLDLLEFAGDRFKKRSTIKLPLPQCEQVVLDEAGQLHGFSATETGIQHRRFNRDGRVTQARCCELEFEMFTVLRASYEKETHLIAVMGKQIIRVIILPEGTVLVSLLIELPYSVYSLWAPQRVAGDQYVMQFTHEAGNGWITLDGDRMKACFFYSGSEAYVDLVSGEEVLTDEGQWILSNIIPTSGSRYCVEFYKLPNSGEENKEVYLLTTTI